MPGIYVHIPFCKQACHYCDFHFSTSLRHRSEMVDAIVHEMELRRGYLPAGEIGTIYFGGGTPSLLSGEELGLIFNRIFQLFTVKPGAEVTLEANPDDLSLDKLRELRRSPVNRLSIGVQSFHEEDLRFFNRAHNAIEARACIEYAQDLDFENLNVDLIFGSPTTSDAHWEYNLQTIFEYEIPHVSAYSLTVEERTALHHFIRTGKTPAPDEEQAARQFLFLMDAMRAEGYEHYEISNFAYPGWRARHNSSYWTGEPYLGLGPSAHSYDGISRQWNVANNSRYIKILNDLPATEDTALEGLLFEQEVLTSTQRYNEYVMTSLRTEAGCHLKKIPAEFRTHFLENIQPHLQGDLVERKADRFRLTDRGKLLADRIASDLFFTDALL